MCQREDLTRHVPARKHVTGPAPEEENPRNASARVPAKDDDTMDLIMKNGRGEEGMGEDEDLHFVLCLRVLG